MSHVTAVGNEAGEDKGIYKDSLHLLGREFLQGFATAGLKYQDLFVNINALSLFKLLHKLLISFPKQSERNSLLGLLSSLHSGTSLYFY
jgi:hypothetical protein